MRFWWVCSAFVLLFVCYALAEEKSIANVPPGFEHFRGRHIAQEALSLIMPRTNTSRVDFYTQSGDKKYEHITITGYTGADLVYLEEVFYRLSRAAPHVPIHFFVGSPHILKRTLLAPYVANIIQVWVMKVNGFNTTSFADLELRYVLELLFYQCEDVVVTKAGLQSFPQLRTLMMMKSTIQSIERNALESAGLQLMMILMLAKYLLMLNYIQHIL